ncbi:MAG: peptide chain release factor N(5)-glutamine methyltransferase [Bdellovibrionales bacterium]
MGSPPSSYARGFGGQVAGMTANDKRMYLTEYLLFAVDKLKHAGVYNPQLVARLIVEHALNIDHLQMIVQTERVLASEDIGSLDGFLERRIKGETVARIKGQREFWGLDFGLNEATLEPRPDSETLVEAVLTLMPRGRAALDSRFRGNDDVRLLDLGTGTGCLLLALLYEMREATGIGIDINPRAIEQAALNAEALGFDGRASFCVGNWLTNVTEKFDIIVSNPPYIPSTEIPGLMKEVRDFDPLLALDGGEDGLVCYRSLIPQLANFLYPNGIVAFEVGDGQAPLVAEIFRQNGFTNIVTHKDLSGIERCVTADRSAS